MRARIPVLLAVSGFAALLPHAGPDGVLRVLRQSFPEPWSVVVHLVAPSALAILLAALWPFLSWSRSVLALAACLLLAQCVRMVLFALPTGLQPLHRLLVDSKDQFLLGLSLSLQMASGLLAFAAARVFVRKAAQQAHAAAERRSGARG